MGGKLAFAERAESREINVKRVALRVPLAAQVVAAAVLLLLGCGSSLDPTSPGSPSASEVEFAAFQLLNSARNGAGVSPELALNQALTAVARAHSEAMRDQGFFSHIDHNGNNLKDRLEAAGINFHRAAENLVRVTNADNPATEMHNLLLGSDDHRENILDSRFIEVGVGVARSDRTYWLTQIFIDP